MPLLPPECLPMRLSVREWDSSTELMPPVGGRIFIVNRIELGKMRKMKTKGIWQDFYTKKRGRESD